MENNDLCNIAVYGTLREGFNNWSYFIDDSPIKTITKKGIRLGVGFLPFAMETGEERDETVFELYRVPRAVAEAIESMEVGAGYQRKTLEEDSEQWVWYEHLLPDGVQITKCFRTFRSE